MLIDLDHDLPRNKTEATMRDALLMRERWSSMRCVE
jgi:hypothetical protein